MLSEKMWVRVWARLPDIYKSYHEHFITQNYFLLKLIIQYESYESKTFQETELAKNILF